MRTKSIIIASSFLLMLCLCTGPTHTDMDIEETRAHRETDTATAGMVITLESDSMLTDTTIIRFDPDQWEEQGQDVTLN